MQKER